MSNCAFCGATAVIQFKSGRFCCHSRVSQCPAIRRINSFKHAGINKDNSSSVKLRADRISEGYRSGRLKHVILSPEVELLRRKRISEKLKSLKCGGYRPGSGFGKKSWHDSPTAGRVFLDSTYEVAFARYLDSQKTEWRKNYGKFPYTYEGVVFNYVPDFYLPVTDEYVEIKGYATSRDEAKWKYFPHKLQVLMKEDLIALGLRVD